MLYNIALSHLRSINAQKFHILLNTFGSAEKIFSAPSDMFQNMGALGKYLSDEKYKSDLLRKAEEELKFINQKNINVLLFSDKRYPLRLKECPDAPILLYTTGDIDFNKGKYISIVGTRKCSSYGRDLTNKFIHELKEILQDDITIISGLAHGIDIAAHKAALDCNVRTFGVVAHGLDTIYPAVNRNTAAKMVQNSGAIITEYPTKTQPIALNFLARNRIVAGMCDTLVVSESASKGGALVTAGLANGYGRNIYAFPGRVGDIASEGCNILLRSNIAGLILSAEDLVRAELWDMHKKPIQQKLFKELTEDQQKITNILQSENLHITDIATQMHTSTSAISSLLIDMEMEGLIQGIPGGRYRLIK